MTSPVQPSLNYAPSRPRWRRRLKHIIAMAIMVTLVAAVWRWGPFAWRRAQIHYYQYQCLNYAPSANQVMNEGDPVAARNLCLANAQYVARPLWISFPGDLDVPWRPASKFATLIPSCWTRFDTLGGVNPPVLSTHPFAAVMFLHERISHAGNRRLVIVRFLCGERRFTSSFVEDFNYQSRVLVPAALTPARLVSPKVQPLADPGQVLGEGANVRIYAGQPDPADLSHFTIRYQMWGQEDVLDGYLNDDDTVKLVARQPPMKLGF